MRSSEQNEDMQGPPGTPDAYAALASLWKDFQESLEELRTKLGELTDKRKHYE